MNVVVLVLIIIGVALLFVALLLGVLALVFARVRKKAQAAIDERFAPSEVVLSSPGANFFGRASKGMAQIRGNGGLALTEEVLWFRLMVPDRILEIPLDRITGVRTDKWFLKKTKGRALLIVDFDLGEGPDSAAWLVMDLTRWQAALEARVG